MKPLARQTHALAYGLMRSRGVAVATALAACAGTALTVLVCATHGTKDALVDLTTSAGQGEALVEPLTGFVMAAVTAGVWGAAQRDGSLLWSFMAARSRLVLAAAVLLCSLVLGLAVGSAVTALKVVALTLSLPPGESSTWWRVEHGVLAVMGAVIAAAVMAVIGAAVALAVRQASVAIALIFGWLLLVEPLVVGLVPPSARLFFPGQALAGIRNGAEDLDLAKAASVVTIATSALVLVAAVMVARRDPA